MIIWGVLGACLAVAGVVVLFAVGAGALTQAPAAHSSTGLWTRAVDKLRGTNPRTWVFLLVAVVLAGGAALWTGWPVMVVIMPVAVIVARRMGMLPLMVVGALFGVGANVLFATTGTAVGL